jgi:hypothetical protein
MDLRQDITPDGIITTKLYEKLLNQYLHTCLHTQPIHKAFFRASSPAWTFTSSISPPNSVIVELQSKASSRASCGGYNITKLLPIFKDYVTQGQPAGNTTITVTKGKRAYLHLPFPP